MNMNININININQLIRRKNKTIYYQPLFVKFLFLIQIQIQEAPMEKYSEEEMLLEERLDLEILGQNISKVQTMQKQFLLQKQQIGTLNNTIAELKFQNNQLRALSKNAKSLTQSNKLDNQEDNLSLKKSDLQHENISSNNQVRSIKDNLANFQASDTNCQKFEQNSNKELDIPSLRSPKRENINIRQQPGHITTNRFYRSPQYKSSNQIWSKDRKGIKLPENSWASLNQLQNAKHIQIKSRLMENLVEEIQSKLRQAQRKLKQQKQSHKQCKKMLKHCIRQNSSLLEQNRQLISRSQLTEKENQYLKQELLKVTQQKHNERQKIGEYQKWHDKFTHKISQQFDYQLEQMEEIYSGIVKLSEKDGFHTNFHEKKKKSRNNKRKQSS